jgi:1-acyl-sn-glycerol-3-phosphate acyltransferase
MRWSVMRTCSWLLAKATATPVKVNGLENLPADGRAYVLVSNHASYLDGYALVAMLPGHFRFVAKEELASSFIVRRPLQNIHAEFVDRFDTSKSVRDTRRLSHLLKQGHALAFFAEGTFTRVPGLMPFHLGAFSVAAEAGVPVIPVAIRGTRSILRSDSWFPHHGSINIEVGEPIDPRDFMQEADNDTWRVAISLRDHSRSFILRHCGEPDLSL